MMMFVKRANFSQWAQKICGLKETLGEGGGGGRLIHSVGFTNPQHTHKWKKGRIIALQRELVEGSDPTDGKREERERESRRAR